mmetsp:Transcript_17883/g.44316  ORF Transcript_17883/g.44316 Transcript_17883/m.44316 type:complete len:370 (+) Transcript_17883:716-1825(+)
MAPCTAAPYATASSGCTDLHRVLPSKNSVRICCTRGTRVEPPTRTISSTASFLSLASSSTRFTESTHRWNRGSQIFSKRARVYGMLISCSPTNASMVAPVEEDSMRLARSHAVRSLRDALSSPVKMSLPIFFLCMAVTSSASLVSKSSPPRCVSPAVASTVKTPSSILSNDTSKVPPPRSNTRMVCSFLAPSSPSVFLRSRPYASAAAVGSLMMRSTSSPAMAPASLVWRRCASLKYAGTVMTAFLIVQPRATSAVFFIFSSTMAEICSGVKVFIFSSISTSMRGLCPGPSLTLNGMSLISSAHSDIWRPMMRFTLNSVRLVFCAAWRLAESPTRRPSSVKATHEGVVRSPSELASTCASPSFHTATHE